MRSHRKFPAFASHIKSDQSGRFMQYGHERQMSEFSVSASRGERSQSSCAFNSPPHFPS